MRGGYVVTPTRTRLPVDYVYFIKTTAPERHHSFLSVLNPFTHNKTSNLLATAAVILGNCEPFVVTSPKHSSTLSTSNRMGYFPGASRTMESTLLATTASRTLPVVFVSPRDGLVERFPHCMSQVLARLLVGVFPRRYYRRGLERRPITTFGGAAYPSLQRTRFARR